MLRKASFPLLLVAVMFSAAACHLPTGPNRMLRVVGPNAVTDFSTFQGTCTQTCQDVTAFVDGADAEGGGVVVGCVLKVSLVDVKTPRTVFCPVGELRDRCLQIPLNSRVAVNGQPLGDQLAFVPTSIDWRGQ